jgi:hypothetical protein
VAAELLAGVARGAAEAHVYGWEGGAPLVSRSRGGAEEEDEKISPYLRAAGLRQCGLRCRSTEHPSGGEGDSDGGEEGEGKGSRDMEKEGGDERCVRRGVDGEREKSSTRVWRRRHGGGEAATLQQSRSRDCGLATAERRREGGGLGLG